MRNNLVAALGLSIGLTGCANHTGKSGDIAAVIPCGGVAAPPAPPADRCGLVCRANLPLRVVENAPLVDVWINGQAATLTLDTGATSTVITRTAAIRLGLPETGRSSTATGVGGTQPARYLEPLHVMFGQESITLPTAADVEHLAPAPGDPVGSFGYDLLSRYEVDIDVPHAQVTLYAGSPCPGPLPGWTDVGPSLRLEPGKLPVFPAMLEGKPIRAMLDTGLTRTLVTRRAALRVGVAADDLDLELAGHVRGYGAGTVPIRIRRFQEVKVGTDSARNLDAMVADVRQGGIGLTLGTDWLATRKLWLSYPTGTVRVSATW